MQTVNIKITDYKAIQAADVDVNGIAVIAGVNGSGKTTLLHMLYHTLRCAADYDKTVSDWFRDELLDVGFFVEKLTKELPMLSPIPVEMPELCDNDTEWRIRAQNYGDALDTAKELFHKLRGNDDKNYRNRLQQYYSIAKDTILHSKEPLPRIYELMDGVKKKVDDLCETTERISQSRSNSPYNQAVRRRCGDIKGKVVVSESGVPIFSDETEFVPMLTNAHHVYYTAGPLRYDNLVTALRMPLDYAELDLVEDLLRDVKRIDGRGNNFFSSVLGGKVYVADDGALRFKDSASEQDINLRKAASGVQSIGPLALLRERSMFRHGDFVMIDEPEMHLHPELAVELSRMIVEMHKKGGTRFVVATHSTDVVSALRYISEKEGVLDRVDFYMAESAGIGKYMFRSTDKDITPIFDSFNKALDRLEEYGTEF